MPEEQRPARSADKVGKVNAADRDAYFPSVRRCQLGLELAQFESASVPSPNQERCQRCQYHQTQDHMVLLQSFSVPRLLICLESSFSSGSERKKKAGEGEPVGAMGGWAVERAGQGLVGECGSCDV